VDILYRKNQFVGSNSVVISGYTASTDFKVTDHAYDKTIQGEEIYFTVLDIFEEGTIIFHFFGRFGSESFESLSKLNDSAIFYMRRIGIR